MRIRRRAAICGTAILVLLALGAPKRGAASELRVCADPNNLPFSNEAGQGFENALAEIIAAELDATVRYTWWAQRRGFIRNTLNAGACDLVIGVPAGYELVATTRPYYRSAYVFVHPTTLGAPVRSLQDPRLSELRIGVHLTGDDGSNPPPVHALGRRGIVDNVVGFMIYGDYREPNPPAQLIEAVVRGDIDVAAAWGPFAGYFAARTNPPLAVERIVDTAPAALPFEFFIAMGVRRDDAAFRDRVQRAIDTRLPELHAVLRRFHVPMLALSPDPATGSEEPAR